MCVWGAKIDTEAVLMVTGVNYSMPEANKTVVFLKSFLLEKKMRDMRNNNAFLINIRLPMM